MINTIIFDFDGTLADPSGGIIRTMRPTLERMGLPTTDDDTFREHLMESTPDYVIDYIIELGRTLA